MSHATGEVIHDGKVVAWYEYNAADGVAISHLYDTYEALIADWRKGERLECTCGRPPLDVLLYTNYGDGFYWPAKACLECHAIVAGFDRQADDAAESASGHPLRIGDD